MLILNHKKFDTLKIQYVNMEGTSYGNLFKFQVGCSAFLTFEFGLK